MAELEKKMENMPWAELIPMTIIVVLFNLIATYLIYMGLFKLDKLRSTANQSLKDSINPMRGVAQEIIANEKSFFKALKLSSIITVLCLKSNIEIIYYFC